jgi:SAM-dependent methyltransferase
VRFDVFCELFAGCPQQGPGSDASTTRAFGLLPPLPERARIFDLGCGTGRQTLTLARLASHAEILAVDPLPTFLSVLDEHAAAAGLSGRIETRTGSMLDPRDSDAPADLIWSEGAIYNVGVEEGLAAFRRCLAPGGAVAFSEISWLADPPREPREFWTTGYPGIRSVEQNLARVEAAGFEPLGHFALPLSDWWDEFYAPLDARHAELSSKYAGDPEALAALGSHHEEEDLLRRFGDVYNYVFYVARVADA